MSAQRLDVTVSGGGTVYLFHLRTETARAWVKDNVTEPLWFGGALAVEHRYARPLADGMLNAGLAVE